jgi:hypothetical protein
MPKTGIIIPELFRLKLNSDPIIMKFIEIDWLPYDRLNWIFSYIKLLLNPISDKLIFPYW